MHDPAPTPIPAAGVHEAAAMARRVQCDRISGRGIARLKCWLRTPGDGEHAVELDGRALPTVTGIALTGEPRVLCLAPGDWLIVSEALHGATLREELKPYIPGHGFALLDLSQALTTLSIAGGSACELLSKGCGLDLHPRSFAAGRCTQTRFAQIPLIIDCVDPQPRFELYSSRSYSSYLQAWLSRASAEFYESGA